MFMVRKWSVKDSLTNKIIEYEKIEREIEIEIDRSGDDRDGFGSNDEWNWFGSPFQFGPGN